MPARNMSLRTGSCLRDLARGYAPALGVAVLCLGSPAALARCDTLIDNLCITDSVYYSTAISSHCGGRARWGDSYDFQAADDFETPSAWFVTRVTWDCLYEYQGTPEAFCWSLYASADDVIETMEYAHGTMEASAAHVEEFDDLVFGYSGKRTSLKVASPPYIAPGRWWVSVQPVSDDDWAYVPALAFNWVDCATENQDMNTRGQSRVQDCCRLHDMEGEAQWSNSGAFEPITLSMRIEGIPAGDCIGRERLRAKCRVRDGEQVGDMVVSVRNGQANGTVTALLDPPDPRSMSIALDDRGRGKGKFRIVPLGEHRVFVCDTVVDVTCGP